MEPGPPSVDPMDGTAENRSRQWAAHPQITFKNPDGSDVLLPDDDDHAAHIDIHQEITLDVNKPWSVRQQLLEHCEDHRQFLTPPPGLLPAPDAGKPGATAAGRTTECAVIAFQQTDAAATFTGAGLTGQPVNSATSIGCVLGRRSAVNSLSLDAFASSVYALRGTFPSRASRCGVMAVDRAAECAESKPERDLEPLLSLPPQQCGDQAKPHRQRTDLAVVLTTPGIKSVSISGESATDAQLRRSRGCGVLFHESGDGGAGRMSP